MLPFDLEALFARVGFRDQAAARARFEELADDDAELLALVRLADHARQALHVAADPDAALRNFSRFVQARGSRLALYHRLQEDPATCERLIRVIGGSQYLADVLVRNPEFLDTLSDGVLLETPRWREELSEELAQTCGPFPAPAAKLDAVRRFRRREILRIGAADLGGACDLRQTAGQLSALADAIVDRCLSIASAASQPRALVVLALGKLGGEELNYSSDIDLMYVAPDGALLEPATRLARALTQALSDATGEGFLYRVDLRLRPYGASGQAVASAEMLADYLATKAHPAERQAMLKARPVAGDLDAGRALLQQLLPTVLADAERARDQVRELKARIERQLVNRGEAVDHVKLAPGGIRDIEFLVQALQLEYGAANNELMTGNTLAALMRLVAAGLVDGRDAHTLREAYIFHRLIEHRLQLMDNQQVHRLPESRDELRVLARTLGIQEPDAAQFVRDAYRDRAQHVRAIFERLLTAPSVVSTLRVPSPPNGTRSVPTTDRLFAAINEPTDVALLAQRESHQRWTITVALWDHLGVLSILTGLYAAHRIDIVSGDVRSLREAGKKRRLRKAMDTFDVNAPRWVDEPFWSALRDELAELVRLLAAGDVESARERIVDRVSQSAVSAQQPPAPLFPIRVEIDNEAAADATRLSIRSTNTLGFLFEFTSSLALLGVNIERVEIRTVHHEVHDTFWVTDAGGRKIVDAGRIHELKVAAALIKQFTHLLPRSPDPAQALRQFSALARQIMSRPDWVADVQSLQSDAVLLALAELMGVSQFLWEDFLREQHENLFPVVRDLPALDQTKSRDQLRAELSSRQTPSAVPTDGTSTHCVGTPVPTADALNQFKDREMFRVDLRHITGRIGLTQFSHELTDLAEVVVEEACGLVDAQLRQRFGIPALADGRECGWCVCALGKFGGRELGYASDIELIVVYAAEGKTSGPNSTANSRYFEECTIRFLQTLCARSEGIFEIDLRLRPHGKAGTLACSLDSFLHYFSPVGEARQFERLALVKLRPFAGDAVLGEQVAAARDRFVYSGRPLDYDNIVHLRRRQAAELVPAKAASAKHSLGGLVDIEYFVQAKQIEAGRAEPRVRVTGTLEAIERLTQAGTLSAKQAHDLSRSYQFLRRLIEALRVVRGHARDLTIPAAGSRDFAHLARRLRYDSPVTLAREIDERMGLAQSLWMDTAHAEAQRRGEKT